MTIGGIHFVLSTPNPSGADNEIFPAIYINVAAAGVLALCVTKQLHAMLLIMFMQSSYCL